MTLRLQSGYLKFNPDTLENVRKEYNLDKPGAMDQAIDILHEWIQKQGHFVKKDFSREYLERFIICSKGSVERAKSRIDKLCTLRTTAPNLFEKCDVNKDLSYLRDIFLSVTLPNLCEDNHRIHVAKLVTKNITPSVCVDAIQHFSMVFEYGKLYDYAKGYYALYDFNDVNVMDIITSINLTDFRNAVALCIEAHGFRIKKICIISSSNMVNALIKFVKQCVSDKIGKRICVLKSAESLHEYLPKKYLPSDYGGEQKSVLDLYDQFNEELSSEKHVSHMVEMRQGTNETLRSPDQFHTECIGMPGTFKMLSID